MTLRLYIERKFLGYVSSASVDLWNNQEGMSFNFSSQMLPSRSTVCTCVIRDVETFGRNFQLEISDGS